MLSKLGWRGHTPSNPWQSPVPRVSGGDHPVLRAVLCGCWGWTAVLAPPEPLLPPSRGATRPRPPCSPPVPVLLSFPHKLRVPPSSPWRSSRLAVCGTRERPQRPWATTGTQDRPERPRADHGDLGQTLETPGDHRDPGQTRETPGRQASGVGPVLGAPSYGFVQTLHCPRYQKYPGGHCWTYCCGTLWAGPT